MAKIILYFNAKEEKIGELVSSCKELGTADFVIGKSLEISVMKPRASDILAVPPKSDFLDSLDLILEIVAPSGNPVESFKHELKLALVPVLEFVEIEKSYLVSAYSKTFQESGKKPERYHYFMYRREDFNRADYMDYYINSHYQFGVATPLADYYQNYVDLEGSAALAKLLGLQAIAADNISELRFDKIDAYVFSDTIREVGPAAAIDEAKFVNRDICQSFSMDVLLDTRHYESESRAYRTANIC